MLTNPMGSIDAVQSQPQFEQRGIALLRLLVHLCSHLAMIYRPAQNHPGKGVVAAPSPG